MNELERWIDLEGPPPPDIRDLFDAARDLPEASPEMSPEAWDDLDRRVFAAIAEDRRREARQRAAKRALMAVVGLGMLVGCVVGALALGHAFVATSPMSRVANPHPEAALAPMIGDNVSAPSSTAPSVSATAPRVRHAPVRPR